MLAGTRAGQRFGRIPQAVLNHEDHGTLRGVGIPGFERVQDFRVPSRGTGMKFPISDSLDRHCSQEFNKNDFRSRYE